MAKTFTAPFAQTPETWNNTATNAFALTGTNSLADGTPLNTVLLGSAGVDGALIVNISAFPRATNTATQATLFIRKTGDAAGVRRPLQSITIPAQTISASVGVITYSFPLASESVPYRLEAGTELYVGLGVTQTGGITFTASVVEF